MTRAVSKRAPNGAASGVCRPPRQRGIGPRGKEWIRPYRRAQAKLDSAAKLIIATVNAVIDAGFCAAKPIKSTQILIKALGKVTAAKRKLAGAQRYLAEAVAALASVPPELRNEDAPELFALAQERCETVEHYILFAAREVLLGHTEIYNGVMSGEVVPEDPSEFLPRPRIVVVVRHNPLFVRAFLSARRQPRVGERITPLLSRRRRMPRPAEVRVPRRNLRGRAPPLASACSF